MLDHDGDGKVSFDEYMKGPCPNENITIKMTFDLIDENGDSIIDEGELVNVERRRADYDEDRIKKFFSSADTNKDKRLSYYEYCVAY